MTQKLKNIFVIIGVMSLALLPPLAMLSTVSAAVPTTVDIKGSLCSGANLDLTDASTGTCTGDTSTTNFQHLLAQIINIFTIVVGVIAVIMIIVGGLRYITSGGDSSRVGAAKTTIIYALVGLVVVALAQLVVHFVLGQSANLTQ